jgi:hypothetical protein
VIDGIGMSSVPVIEQITIQKHTIPGQEPMAKGHSAFKTMGTGVDLNIPTNLCRKSKIKKKIKKMK